MKPASKMRLGLGRGDSRRVGVVETTTMVGPGRQPSVHHGSPVVGRLGGRRAPSRWMTGHYSARRRGHRPQRRAGRMPAQATKAENLHRGRPGDRSPTRFHKVGTPGTDCESRRSGHSRCRIRGKSPSGRACRVWTTIPGSHLAEARIASDLRGSYRAPPDATRSGNRGSGVNQLFVGLGTVGAFDSTTDLGRPFDVPRGFGRAS